MNKEVEGLEDVGGENISGDHGLDGCAFGLRYGHPQGCFPEHEPIVAAVPHANTGFRTQSGEEFMIITEDRE
jgi:hypothetical protein